MIKYRKMKAVVVVAYCFLMVGCSTATDKHNLRINFLPGKYTLEIYNKTRYEINNEPSLQSAYEELWEVHVPSGEYPPKVSLELKKKFTRVA